MAADATKKYWYNLRTGAVEHGLESPSVDRAGPFDTEAEAASAPDRLRANAQRWADEERADDA
ncbi:SPOR domain-containing protein [Labedella endophytica]|jgi:hypothetical protein|uniref:SPOR domain-containing protein n=1 Tax=Labedella endophytica TaxID=1523160 RepID=A0A3S0VAL1_9MICO|nr:SPOR domain-containing protein [Labedella endophytica]RUR00786.1 SPOR domain-containing protein [Labedella endophytica]